MTGMYFILEVHNKLDFSRLHPTSRRMCQFLPNELLVDKRRRSHQFIKYIR